MDSNFLNRIRRRERIAQRVIVAGGILIVMAVLGILLQIASVAVPLFYSPDSTVESTFALEPARHQSVVAVGIDEYLETGYVLFDDGSVLFYRVSDGAELSRASLHAGDSSDLSIRSLYRHGVGEYTVVWSDGLVSRDAIEMEPFFLEDGTREIRHRVRRSFSTTPPDGVDIVEAAAVIDDGGSTWVGRTADGGIEIYIKTLTEDLFGDIDEVDHSFSLDNLPGTVSHLILAVSATELYATTENGVLLRATWNMSDPEDPVEPRLDDRIEVSGGASISALGFVFGDQAVVVGDEEGTISRWFPVRSSASGGRRILTRIGDLPAQNGAVLSLQPTQRDKSVISLGADGVAHLDHSTSNRRLLDFGGDDATLRLASLNRRGDGLVGLDRGGRLHIWSIDNPHPEVSLTTLFRKVWYEGYDEPSYDWQSSAATQDAEPKLSLVPLLFGTLKGTLYAMIFAVPLAVLGALYTSQFLGRRLRGIVKPLIEIMAAIPSVVIGFLAAQWFAPILQRSMGGLLLSLILLPMTVLATFALWQRLGAGAQIRKLSDGLEFVLLVPTVLGVVLGTVWAGSALEPILFDGDLQTFLYESVGVIFDPRNCVVIAFALGFAVVPLIFTIAEDSLANVPRSLSAGSLALGASRWQTAWRVVLPAALPGIFAATMIGLGRAIGETMIVLMATGNTAIMDWSPLNGMRTISANIATEAPEAPHLGSLYRVLFLSAVILFVSTFVLNTVAEIVRHRIRKKYARF